MDKETTEQGLLELRAYLVRGQEPDHVGALFLACATVMCRLKTLLSKSFSGNAFCTQPPHQHEHKKLSPKLTNTIAHLCFVSLHPCHLRQSIKPETARQQKNTFEQPPPHIHTLSAAGSFANTTMPNEQPAQRGQQRQRAQ